MFVDLPTAIEHIRAGRLRTLAVTTATRSEALPDIPSVGEFLPGYESSFWAGLGAPRNIPSKMVQILNKEINAALNDPAVKARISGLGGNEFPGSPIQFGTLLADETAKWAKVIRAANIKPE